MPQWKPPRREPGARRLPRAALRGPGRCGGTLPVSAASGAGRGVCGLACATRAAAGRRAGTTPGTRRGCRGPPGPATPRRRPSETRWRRSPTSSPKTYSSCTRLRPRAGRPGARPTARLARTSTASWRQPAPTAGDDPDASRRDRRRTRDAGARRAAEPTVPVLVDLARAAAKAGDHRWALRYLAHARSLEPQNATVHFLFGIVCVEARPWRRGVRVDEEGRVAGSRESGRERHRWGGRPASARVVGSGAIFREVHAPAAGRPAPQAPLGIARFYSDDLDGAQHDLAQVPERPRRPRARTTF